MFSSLQIHELSHLLVMIRELIIKWKGPNVCYSDQRDEF